MRVDCLVLRLEKRTYEGCSAEVQGSDRAIVWQALLSKYGQATRINPSGSAISQIGKRSAHGTLSALRGGFALTKRRSEKGPGYRSPFRPPTRREDAGRVGHSGEKASGRPSNPVPDAPALLAAGRPRVARPFRIVRRSIPISRGGPGIRLAAAVVDENRFRA